MYYPVMNVTQCEGQLSTYHLNGGSMTTPQSEEKKKKKKKKKKKELNNTDGLCAVSAVVESGDTHLTVWTKGAALSVTTRVMSGPVTC